MEWDRGDMINFIIHPPGLCNPPYLLFLHIYMHIEVNPADEKVEICNLN